MTLGRTIRLVGGEGQSTVPVKWLTRVFVGADVLTLQVQGAGQREEIAGANSYYRWRHDENNEAQHGARN